MPRSPNRHCCICNTPVYRPPSQDHFKTYCSKTCLAIGRNWYMTCDQCGGVFKKERGRRKYCSRACSNKGRTGIRYTGKQPGNRAKLIKWIREQLAEQRGNQCELCHLGPEWQGKPLLLQVDHVDGNNRNDDMSNVRLLCPNCHTQTPTYCRGKKGLQQTRPEGLA